MIPILFEKTETEFDNNGLGRLRDCTECIVSEERNGIYECDFSYPVTGAHYDDIKLGRIIGVTHDDTGDLEPFDIVSFSKPINGVVSFHAVHISYRQSYMTVTGSNINSLADAFALLGTAEPDNPFVYQTDKDSLGYMAAADGTPRSVRQMLGGVEGSILDAYGGEYEWSNFVVYLHSARGVERDFSIRYGVNMLDYNEDYDSQGTYSSCVPYWTDGENTVVGDRQDSPSSTITGRGECVPLDVSDKFEEQPTKAQVEAMGLSMLTGQNTALPTQNIHVEFVRLQDLGYENLGNLMQCKLCDTISVIFPDYNATGRFKIVKTVWNVLKDRYDSMELGDLSISLSEALGVNSNITISGGGGGGVVSTSVPTANVISEFDNTAHMNSTDMTAQEVDDFVDNIGGGGSAFADKVVEQGTSGIWTYRKWNSGIAECWYSNSFTVNFDTQVVSSLRTSTTTNSVAMPSFLTSVTEYNVSGYNTGTTGWATLVTGAISGSNIILSCMGWTTAGNQTIAANIYIKGTWK